MKMKNTSKMNVENWEKIKKNGELGQMKLKVGF